MMGPLTPAHRAQPVAHVNAIYSVGFDTGFP